MSYIELKQSSLSLIHRLMKHVTAQVQVDHIVADFIHLGKHVVDADTEAVARQQPVAKVQRGRIATVTHAIPALHGRRDSLT